MQPTSQLLAGKIALITGASRGIGASIAKRYAAEGAHVILVARSRKGLEEVDDAIQTLGGNATLVPMDLREGASIDQLGASIHERFGKLDILVGNAAILGDLTPVSHLKPDVWEKVISTNLTANYRLIRSMDALLRQSSCPVALFVTSGITQSTHPFWGAYATSKAGLETLVATYAAEVKHTGMNVAIVDPGIARTRMRTDAFPGEDPADVPHPDSITDRFMPFFAHA